MSPYGDPAPSNPAPFLFGGIMGFTFIVILVIAMMWGCPQYEVYSKRQSGEAELAQAEYTRKVAVLEANAKRDAAQSLAAADTLRAHGVAESNRIIGQSLKQNDEYLTWLWIESLKEKGNEVIYVPTEANLPVLEAMRKMKVRVDTVKK